MTAWVGLTLALGGGYALGAIPFGLILTRIGGVGDLRTMGSGNIGATNVLRTGRRGLALATLLLDGAKGAAAVLIAGALVPELAPVAATGAFLGHLYPVWLRFRGGKGVATLLGVALALHWPSALAFALMWVAVLAITRTSSLAGMAAGMIAPVCAAWFARFDLSLLFLALALLLVWRHRANIDRLLDGTEPKVGARPAPEPLG